MSAVRRAAEDDEKKHEHDVHLLDLRPQAVQRKGGDGENTSPRNPGDDHASARGVHAEMAIVVAKLE
jgi:hypothetical protein